MQPLKTELTDVIYNAATQAFEARVTVHGADGPQSYACALDAPITLSFTEAAEGLTRQALRKHDVPEGMRSWIAPAKLERVASTATHRLRRGLPLGQYGYFRGRATRDAA